MKIYTRAGDDGRTALLGGTRVPKDDARVAAYGDVDELSAALGTVRALGLEEGDDTLLRDLQRDLFAVGAQLADATGTVGAKYPKCRLDPARVEALEQAIDAREAGLPPLTAFILPGGAPAGAQLHLARTVCRRAERAVIALAHREAVDPLLVRYLNRVSDLLFVLARHVNHGADQPEETW